MVWTGALMLQSGQSYTNGTTYREVRIKTCNLTGPQHDHDISLGVRRWSLQRIVPLVVLTIRNITRTISLVNFTVTSLPNEHLDHPDSRNYTFATSFICTHHALF